MRVNPFSGSFLLTALLLVLSTSCKKEVRNETADDTLTPALSADAAAKKSADAELLQSVRRATSRFHSTTQAINAGYLPDDHCVSVPGLGGMGYHWVNPNLVNPTFDPLQPEAVLYEADSNGNLHLVALEYIVINTGQATPMFGSQPFDVGGTPIQAPHWSLHVWLYKDNPTGMFMPFNPNVSCP